MNEKDYSVQQIAKQWERSAGYIRKLFRNEDGVIHSPWSGLFGKRHYDNLRIPESVMMRVRERLKRPPVKMKLPHRELQVAYLRPRKPEAASSHRRKQTPAFSA